MKPNTRSFARSSRLTQIVALSTFTLALQVACSDDPVANQPVIPGASGSGAGTVSTSGTTSTAGTFGSTAGTGGSSSGGTFGTAGATTAGSGGATGGTGGTTAGTANGGTAGTTVVVPPLDCATATNVALPIPLVSKWGFPDSGDDSFSEAPILAGAAATTAAGLPDGTTDVWGMTWTPTVRLYVHWYWHSGAANWAGQGVCVAAGAKVVTLKAKAATEGVVVEFQAAGIKKSVTLGAAWQDVVIDLPANYNTLNPAGGVNTGLVVVMVRPDTTDTTVRTIYFHDVKWAVEAGGGGGEGGAGNGSGGEGGAN